jgi:hypothetical protein
VLPSWLVSYAIVNGSLRRFSVAHWQLSCFDDSMAAAGSHPVQPKRRYSDKGSASGWLEKRLGNKHRKNPSVSYYYGWLDQGHQCQRYVPVAKVGQVTQMISDRCGVEEILALLKVKG